MNSTLFKQAIDKVIDHEKIENGIGTLGEKTVHAVLKNYLSPDSDHHEKKINNYYADIYNKDGIIEIQTGNFNKLRKKLSVFLEMTKVTICYPIPATKYLRWVNLETGEISPPRKSPKKGTPYMIFPELYKIKDYLSHPNLCILIILIDLEEYKLLDGWSQDKKKGSTKSDRIPLSISNEIYIRNISDYEKLIPNTLPSTFTSKEYKKESGLYKSHANTALNVLYSVGALQRVGKEGRFYVYSR
ncbi:MAG: hypothetical protein ACK5JH_13470 [Anaerocolumna sp.]